jgi:non-ribosomal peptide synthetase component F
MTMGDLTMEWERMDVLSKFDLAVFVVETTEGIVGNWAYSAELFDPATIARMADLYRIVLENATATPTIRLSELLRILSEEDKQHRSLQHKEFQQSSVHRLQSAKRKTLT